MGKQPTWPGLCLEAGLADKLVVEGSKEGERGLGVVKPEGEFQIHPPLSSSFPNSSQRCEPERVPAGCRQMVLGGCGPSWNGQGPCQNKHRAADPSLNPAPRKGVTCQPHYLERTLGLILAYSSPERH